MGDEVLHRDQPEAVTSGEALQLWHPRHRSVGVRALADHSHRGEPGEPAEIDGALGLPGAYEAASVGRLARQRLPGPYAALPLRLSIGHHLDGLRALGG